LLKRAKFLWIFVTCLAALGILAQRGLADEQGPLLSLYLSNTSVTSKGMVSAEVNLTNESQAEVCLRMFESNMLDVELFSNKEKYRLWPATSDGIVDFDEAQTDEVEIISIMPGHTMTVRVSEKEDLIKAYFDKEYSYVRDYRTGDLLVIRAIADIRPCSDVPDERQKILKIVSSNFSNPFHF
jgi:hypothetical protein